MVGLIIGAWVVPGALLLGGGDVPQATIGFAVGVTFASVWAVFFRGASL